MKQHVIYTRVSTEEQGRSGLGLEAQERDIGIYLETFSEVPWEIIGRFQDVLFGGSDDRPKLVEALKLVRPLVRSFWSQSWIGLAARSLDPRRVHAKQARLPRASHRPPAPVRRPGRNYPPQQGG